MFPPDAHLETHFMFDMHISQVIVLHIEEQGFLFCCFLCTSCYITLHWRHNDHDGVSIHQPHDCLLNISFRHRGKKTSKLRVTGLCEGVHQGPVNSPHKGPVTRKMFPFDDVIIKSDYYTSSWYLIRWVYNSISAFIHLPGWPFHLNYGLRLSITLYFWFCNYSRRSDIFALQYWVEYVTHWSQNYIFPIGIFCRDVPGSAASCSCGVWYRELKTTYTSCTLVICLEI